jgi:hypothetical protein
MAMKIVKFHDWCGTCTHAECLEDQPPCDDCLSWPVNEDSHKPVNYEPSARHKGKEK